jgi:hypothetical protein
MGMAFCTDNRPEIIAARDSILEQTKESLNNRPNEGFSTGHIFPPTGLPAHRSIALGNDREFRTEYLTETQKFSRLDRQIRMEYKSQ